MALQHNHVIIYQHDTDPSAVKTHLDRKTFWIPEDN